MQDFSSDTWEFACGLTVLSQVAQMAPSSGSSADMVAYLVRHIVLPPQLRQQDDHAASHDQDLLAITL
jgi:hypothetical protein